MKRLLSMILTVLFVLFAFCGCSDDHLIGNTSFSDSEVTEDGINSEISQTESKEVAPESAESAESSEEPIPTEVGETFYFGSFEQDNDTANGKEPIEWIVLDKTEEAILIISKCILDCRQFHETDIEITWENCSLRTWLNGEFYNEAFGQIEKELICDIKVTAQDSTVGFYPEDGGNDTVDKVYILGTFELRKYFSKDSDRSSKSTEYTAGKGLRTDKYGKSQWWGRTPGITKNRALFIGEHGNLQPGGSYVQWDLGVRPAMWIKIK